MASHLVLRKTQQQLGRKLDKRLMDELRILLHGECFFRTLIMLTNKASVLLSH
jgi:hypothetical protein